MKEEIRRGDKKMSWNDGWPKCEETKEMMKWQRGETKWEEMRQHEKMWEKWKEIS